MRKITVLFFMLIVLFATILLGSEMITEVGTDTLAISSKTFTIVLNTKLGVLDDIRINVDRKVVDIYTYYPEDPDGYNVYGSNGELIPNSFSYEEDENGNILVRFLYDTGTKTFVVKNDPYYDFDVILSFSEEITAVSIPYISEINQKVHSNFFITYAKPDKQKTVCVSYSEEGSFAEKRFYPNYGSATISAFAGPVKLIHISEALPEIYDEIKGDLEEFGAIGFTSYIFHGLVAFLYWLYKLTNSFGWAIILFTIVVRLVLYPLYHLQTKSMIQMRAVQPEIEKIKKKYKDPQKQQQALTKLYREKNINPATGCLALLIQLPVFFVLYAVIRYFGEMFAYSPKFLIWSDLSTGGFVINLPFIIITILAGFYMSLFTSQDPRAARQGMIFNVMFPFLFYSFPSGLFLYYTTNTVIQMLITIYVYRKFGIKKMTVREVLGLPPKPVK